MTTEASFHTVEIPSNKLRMIKISPFQYTNYFTDYMDYRLRRKHHGALARSILNQMDLDAARPLPPPPPPQTRSNWSEVLFPYSTRFNSVDG